MQYPTKFPTDIEVSKFGKPIIFMTRPEIFENRVDGFFLVKEFLVTQDEAHVTFDYYYDYTTNQKVDVVKLVLKKTADNWEISESNIGKR